MRDGGFMSKALEVLSAAALVVIAGTAVWVHVLKPSPQGAPAPADTVNLTVPLLNETRLFGVSRTAVVEFTDYECPFCQEYATTVLPTVRNADVSYFSINLPLPMHPQAEGAAIAAICAAQQRGLNGMHRKLFSGPLNPTQYSAYATEVGLDAVTFERCRTEAGAKASVDAHKQIARKLNVRSTPSLFLGAIEGDSIRLTRRVNWKSLEAELKTWRPKT
jgi:protein-disulfide isomerase